MENKILIEENYMNSFQGLGNNITRKSFEIMAPAGSWESLWAAIKAGADSVYFGIEKLNTVSYTHLDVYKRQAQGRHSNWHSNGY